MKKRIIAFILAFFVIPMLIGIKGVYAQELSGPILGEASLNQAGAFEATEASISLFGVETVQTVLDRGFSDMEKEIYLYHLMVREDEMKQAFQNIINNNPRYFYVATEYHYYLLGEYVYSVVPTYTMTKTEVGIANNLIDMEVGKAIGTTHSSMSDAEKALAVHDYFCAQFEYDLTHTNYDIFSFVRDRTGVCQSYALFYMEIMRTLGIPCEFVPSDEKHHAWNLVFLDGNWYHVDVTHDDVLYDLAGRAKHTHFMVDDATILEMSCGQHTGFTADYEATDSSYNERCWDNIACPMVYVNGAWYTAGYDNFKIHLYSYDFEKDELTSVYHTTLCWEALDGPGVWPGCYSGLFAYGERVIFNLRDGFYQYDTNTGNTEKIYGIDRTDGYIYGSFFTEDSITYCMSTTPNHGHFNEWDESLYTLHHVLLSDIFSEEPTMNITAQVTEDAFQGYVIVSDGEYCVEADLIIVAYDEDGRLKGCSKTPLTLDENKFHTVTIPFTAENVKKIQTFLFARGTMTPLVNKEVLEF